MRIDKIERRFRGYEWEVRRYVFQNDVSLVIERGRAYLSARDSNGLPSAREITRNEAAELLMEARRER